MPWSSIQVDEFTEQFWIVLNPDSIVLLSALAESYEGMLGAVHTQDQERAVVTLTAAAHMAPVVCEFLESLGWVSPLPENELKSISENDSL